MDAIANLPSALNNLSNSIKRSNDQLIELFMSISNDMIQTMQEQGELTRKKIEHCFEDYKVDNEDRKEYLESLNNSTKTCMVECTQKMITGISQALSNNCSITVTDDHESLRERENCAAEWNKKLRERKSFFEKYHRNKTIHQIYLKELEKDEPRMPRKFQPFLQDGIPDEEVKIRKQLAIDQFKGEIKIIEMRMNRFNDKLTKVNEYMKNYFDNNYEPTLAKKMLLLWEKENQKEEINIIREFTRKENFIEENLTDKPKTPNNDNSNEYNRPQYRNTEEPNKNSRNNGNYRQDTRRTGYQQRPQSFDRPPYQRSKPRNGNQYNTQPDYDGSNPAQGNDNGNVIQTHQNEQGMRNFRKPPNHQRRY